MVSDFSEEKVFPDYNPECARLAKVFTWGVSNSVGFATESTETFEFFLRGLSDLCGKGSFSPFF
jgi:hypothetical protein